MPVSAKIARMIWSHGGKPGMGARLAVGVLAVGLCGCSVLSDGGRPSAMNGQPASGPVSASSSPAAIATLSPRAVSVSTLKRVPAKPALCRQPPRRVDDFRAPLKRSSWKTLTVDSDDMYAEPTQVSVAADGTLWALYNMRLQDSKSDRLRRWDGAAWQTFDVPPPPIKRIKYPLHGEHPVDTALVVTSAQQAQVFNVVELARDSPSAQTITLGVVVHTFNAGRWRSEILPVTHSTHVTDAGNDPVFADGSWVILFGRRVLHWDGSSWQLHTLTTRDLDSSGAKVFSDDEAEPWAVVSRRMLDDHLLRWEGSGWREIGLPAPGPPSPREDPEWEYNLWFLTDVVALGAHDVWALGDVTMSNLELEGNGPARSLAWHWDGDLWSCHWGPVDNLSHEHAEPDGAGGLWMTSARDLECPPSCGIRTTELLHLSEGRWTREQLPVPDGCAADVKALVRRPASQEVYAVGDIYPDGEKTCRVPPPGRVALWRTG